MAQPRLLIAGELLAGAGAALEVENPYTERTLASAASASADEVEATVADRQRRRTVRRLQAVRPRTRGLVVSVQA